jgi:hypothetical protein
MQRDYDRYEKRNEREFRHHSHRRSVSPGRNQVHDKREIRHHSRQRSISPAKNEDEIKKSKLEAMMKNAKSVNETRLERISKDREEDTKTFSEEKTNASTFSAMLSRSVYEKGSASDMIQRNRAFAAK